MDFRVGRPTGYANGPHSGTELASDRTRVGVLRRDRGLSAWARRAGFVTADRRESAPP